MRRESIPVFGRIPIPCETCGRHFLVILSASTRKYCGWSCYRDRFGSPAGRYWIKVDQSRGPTACWPWLASRTHDGYGVFTVGRRTMHAHRMAYALAAGASEESLKGLSILHACHNPLCCNPAHLSLGTPSENMADKVRAGRQSRGSGHGMARLTEEDVRTIRTAHARGASLPDLGRRYRVTATAIWQIVHRKHWRHVP